MKHRPPVRTAEIVAYNWGARGRSAGVLPGDLLPLGGELGSFGLDAGALDALSRLGPDAFERWALKGWAESPPP